MIKTSTKIFAVAPLLLLVISKIIFMQGSSISESFLWMAYIAMVILMVDLIVENTKAAWLYSCILVLILLAEIGDLSKMMHWPLSPTMVAGGLLGTLLMSVLFFYNATKAGGDQIKHEHFVLSVSIFIQLFLTIMFSMHYDFFAASYAQVLYYPIALMCAIILFKRKHINLGERNLILYLLVNSLFSILIHTF